MLAHTKQVIVADNDACRTGLNRAFEDGVSDGSSSMTVKRLNRINETCASRKGHLRLLQISGRPCNLLPKYSQRFVDDWLGCIDLHLAIERHWQQLHRPSAELESRHVDIGSEGDRRH